MLFFTCTNTLVCGWASEIVAAFVISPLILFTICFKMRTFAALALFQLLFFCFWFCCCIDAYESAVTYTFPFFPFLLYPIQMSLYYAVLLLRPCLACHFVSPHFALSQSLPSFLSFHFGMFVGAWVTVSLAFWLPTFPDFGSDLIFSHKTFIQFHFWHLEEKLSLIWS